MRKLLAISILLVVFAVSCSAAPVEGSADFLALVAESEAAATQSAAEIRGLEARLTESAAVIAGLEQGMAESAAVITSMEERVAGDWTGAIDLQRRTSELEELNLENERRAIHFQAVLNDRTVEFFELQARLDHLLLTLGDEIEAEETRHRAELKVAVLSEIDNAELFCISLRNQDVNIAAAVNSDIGRGSGDLFRSWNALCPEVTWQTVRTRDSIFIEASRTSFQIGTASWELEPGVWRIAAFNSGRCTWERISADGQVIDSQSTDSQPFGVTINVEATDATLGFDCKGRELIKFD